ncbi:hypothetical protein, partial [Mesorhizobium sp. M2C.T.Ca.TU.002.02.1.1]|uniref:hypothetical protein n=1 Tax=Mesorhizobium sp. M2C.T.Ca.TU.002.02.1.1 TaxID=2496788 RepID=UPI0019D30485
PGLSPYRAFKTLPGSRYAARFQAFTAPIDLCFRHSKPCRALAKTFGLNNLSLCDEARPATPDHAAGDGL